MKTIVTSIFFAAVCCMTQQAMAQNALGCNATRYLTDVYPNFTQTTVEFGRNTTWFGTVDPLYMDIYQPTGDTLTKRPTIVLAFGGGFIAGTRGTMAETAKFYVKKGYVTVTFDYRLYQIGVLGFPDSAKILPAIVQAMHDMKAAIRFLRKDAATTNTFRIDPNNIIGGGVSAGAITALLVGMMDSTDNLSAGMRSVIAAQGGFEGNSGSAGYSSSVKGIINMSGALLFKSWLDAGDPPFVSYHGTADDVVPYGFGRNVYNFLCYGSRELHDQALQLRIPSTMITAQGGGHSNIYDPAGAYATQAADFSAKATVFLRRLICGESPLETNDLNIGTIQNMYPNPVTDHQLNLNFNLKSTVTDLSFEVLNNMGQLVQKVNGGVFSTGDNHYTLNINGLANGIYFLRPISEQGTIGTFKFIVQ
jgi:predicted esterase